MKLIEEMREYSRCCMPVAGKKINDWADRLERATVLVAVPDGEACEYGDSNCDLMTVDGVLIGFDGCGCHIWLHGENEDKAIHAGTIVVPVRLVPLAEAEL